MGIKIKKAKLAKNGTIEASYIDEEGNEIIIKGSHACHDDLKDAIGKLVPYFADLTEQKESDRIDWNNHDSAENADLLRKLEVTGVSISGEDNSAIVTLTGKRTLLTSRVLNINAPGVELNAEVFDWNHIDDFEIDVMAFFFEVEQYITSNKYKIVQHEMSFDNSEDPFDSTDAPDDAPDIEQSVESVA